MCDDKTWIPTHTNREAYDDIKLRARLMRKQPTPAEKILWRRLRDKQVYGYKFRRQHPIDRFIVDFYCRESGLVIEVDGSVHDSSEAREYDDARQEFLEHRGLTVLRFSNAQVLNDVNSVLHTVSTFLTDSKDVN
ncbi:MAG: endonuclease domain-containing protein [Chloroflexi bacterium]|nr:endonuclease domain-containing protein [Chloroflexota bacterium]